MNKSRIFLYLIITFTILLQFNVVHAAWWNSSYSYRRNVSNETSSNLALSINGTNKFCNQTIWANSFNYDGLVAGYHFTGNANDMTGNYDGTVSGATLTTDKNSNSNSAYSFDGSNDYIDTNYQTTISQNSFCMWIKKDQTNYPSSGERDFFGAQDNNDDYWTIGFHNAQPDKLMYAYKDNNGNYEMKNGATTIDTNWHFVCYTVDGSNIKIYLDGVEETMNTMSSSGTIGSLTLNNNFGIGKSIPNTNSEFDGKIDEVRIYDKALTQSEVTNLYNKYDQDYVDSDIYLYYNNCSDTVVYDNANNKTIPYEIEELGTGYDITNVYNSDATAIYHFGDISKTNYVVNGATGTTGKIGNAYSFDGSDDYISLFETPTPTIKSICGWFKTDTTNPSGIQALIDGGNSNAHTTQIIYRGDLSGNPIEVYGSDSSSYKFKQFSNPFTDTTSFYHLCGVLIDNDVKLYVNGVEQTAITSGGSATGTLYFQTESGYPFALGRRNSNADRYFSGDSDDVRIYNSTLNSTEISDLYNSDIGTQNENIKPSNLVFHSTMESGSDSTGNGNDGTVNGATWISNGEYGGAYDFDGTANNYIDIGYSDKFETQDVTVSMWVKLDGSSSKTNPHYHMLFVNDCDFASNKYHGYLLKIDNSDIALNKLTSATSSVNLKVTDKAYDDNQWYHIVGIISSTEGMKIYVNGVLKASNTDTSAIYYTGDKKYQYIGTYYADGQSTNGIIDEVRIYNRALTSTEISNIYDNSQYKNMQLGAEESSTPIAVLNATATIYPTSATIQTDSFTGYCSINSSITENLTISWKWYVNGVLNASGSQGGYLSNNTYNVSVNYLPNLIKGDTVIFSCNTNDSTTSTDYSNSSLVNITTLYDYSYCSGITSQIFSPNLSKATIIPFYNVSRWQYYLTSYNNSAENQTLCLYNISGNTNSSVKINVNITNPTFRIKCSPNTINNAIILNLTPQTIFNITAGENKYFSCWADYINETQERNVGIEVD